MAYDTLVTEQTESGRDLIDELTARGFDVSVAFWAKPSELGKWYLYVASPLVDEKGAIAAYEITYDVVRQRPDLGLDLFEIKLLSLTDPMARAALAAITPKSASGTVPPREPKRSPRMIRLGETSLGGTSIDGAFVYPPLHQAASA